MFSQDIHMVILVFVLMWPQVQVAPECPHWKQVKKNCYSPDSIKDGLIKHARNITADVVRRSCSCTDVLELFGFLVAAQPQRSQDTWQVSHAHTFLCQVTSRFRSLRPCNCVSLPRGRQSSQFCSAPLFSMCFEAYD